jgi:hypothetical protein
MPYRQNAESLQQILDDAVEMAMSPQGANRRTEVQRMVERIDRALALSDVAPEGRDDEVVQSLRHVRDVLTMKGSTRTPSERPPEVTPADEAEARSSARGVQLRIIEVTLKESAVGAAAIDVVRFAAQRAPLKDEQRTQLAASVTLLRDRYESGTTLLRLATLEPCSALHEKLLNRKFDRLEDDLKRVFDLWQRGQRRLSRA